MSKKIYYFNKCNISIYKCSKRWLNYFYNQLLIILIIFINFKFINIKLKRIRLIGDWGLGIGDWGLGIGDWAQSPIPNPQSPVPNPHFTN